MGAALILWLYFLCWLGFALETFRNSFAFADLGISCASIQFFNSFHLAYKKKVAWNYYIYVIITCNKHLRQINFMAHNDVLDQSLN